MFFSSLLRHSVRPLNIKKFDLLLYKRSINAILGNNGFCCQSQVLCAKIRISEQLVCSPAGPVNLLLQIVNIT
jgi:hypothetical protein